MGDIVFGVTRVEHAEISVEETPMNPCVNEKNKQVFGATSKERSDTDKTDKTGEGFLLITERMKELII